jgi:hypothetical protein
MISNFRARLTYANIVSSLALFLALGGVSYAAATLPKNSVGSKQIKSNAVTSSKVKNGSLLGKDFKAGQLPKGATGPQGPQGPKGDTGTVDTSNFYSKAQGDARYLRSTVVVVKTVAASIAANSFAIATVDCPAGYQAVGGGVDPNGVFFGKVSSSAPTFGGTRTSSTADGEQGPATGWSGAVTTEGAGTGTGVVKVAVVCSPIG